jgi:glutathione S-transferase
MKIYGDQKSGNCYKIELLCSLLQRPHSWIDINILNRETRTTDFLEKNPVGQIPLLELDDGRYLSESNAILHYLARDSELLPSDPYLHAKMLQWQFFEQYSHEPYIAVARFINLYLGLPDDRLAEYRSKQEGGHKALTVMQQQLEVHPWLVGEDLTLADISLFAYTHVAYQGGFDLGQYPAIQNWIERIRQLPRFTPMTGVAE